mmetsp:Transcript_50559/g.163829  ORF Transcript_50559/g.163829 Transcript_50559/m.163829 type:complete len:423 (-) Transcript_50559:208-1476(-)
MPGGKHANMMAWAPEEDQVILDMVQQEGPKWSRIVQQLPGRTVSSVRNRWQRIEKGRKLREAGIESKNRCHACGEPKRGHICFQKLRGGPQVDLRLPAPMGIDGVRRVNPEALRHMSPQMGQPMGGVLPAVVTGVTTNAFPAVGPIGGLAPPPPRRTRSQERIYLEQQGHFLQPHPAGRGQHYYNGGSSLFPPAEPFAAQAGAEVGGSSSGLQPPPVDVSHRAPQPRPSLERSNTSFFATLGQDEAWSPSTRELFESWADSPRGKTLPAAFAQQLSALAANPDAPPALKRAASGQGGGRPLKVTRSLSGYLAQGGLGAALPPLTSFPGPPPAPSEEMVPGGSPVPAAAALPFGLPRPPSMTADELQLDLAACSAGVDSAPSPRGGAPTPAPSGPAPSGRPAFERRRSSRLSIAALLEAVVGD